MIEYRPGDSLLRQCIRVHGSVVPQALSVAVPSLMLTVLLIIFEDWLSDFRKEIGLSPSNSSVIWAALSAPLFTLISFRTSQAWGRFWEGTSLLHAMRGEWFDSASCLVTFTVGAKATNEEEVMDFRHTLIRLMSVCHGSALDELKIDQTESYEVLDLLGLDEGTLQMLCNAKGLGFNRVEVLLHLTQVLVTTAMKKGIIDVPPPVLSRVYQTLSRGFVNLLNAKKIKDTNFPFPHAQAIALLLLLLAVFTPLVMTTLVNQTVFACFATFIPIFGLCCLNYTAGELEMPFGDDANDLPLNHFQQEMNSSLLMLMHPCSDHVPSLGHKAIRDFKSFSQSLFDRRNSMDHLEQNTTSAGPAPARRGRQSMFVSAMATKDANNEEEVQEDPEVSSIWTPPTENTGAEKTEVGATMQSTDEAIQGLLVLAADAGNTVALANVDAAIEDAMQPRQLEAQAWRTDPKSLESTALPSSPTAPAAANCMHSPTGAAHGFQAMLQALSPRLSLSGRGHPRNTLRKALPEQSKPNQEAATGQPLAIAEDWATPRPSPSRDGEAASSWRVGILHSNV